MEREDWNGRWPASPVLLACVLPVLPALARFYAVPAGTITLDGGTERVDFDGAAFVGGGGPNDSITGTLVNDLAGPITDVTISLKRKGSGSGMPQVGSVTVDGHSDDAGPVPSGRGEGATVTGLSIAPDNSVSFSVNDVSAGGADDLVLRITPSVADKPLGSSKGANVIDGVYAQTSMADLMRRGLEEAWHDRVVANVTNDDPRHDIDSLYGLLTLPADVRLSSVHVQDADQGFLPWQGARVSITAPDRFELDLTTRPVRHAQNLQLVLVFSRPLAQETVRLLLEATFTP